MSKHPIYLFISSKMTFHWKMSVNFLALKNFYKMKQSNGFFFSDNTTTFTMSLAGTRVWREAQGLKRKENPSALFQTFKTTIGKTEKIKIV